MSLTHLRRRGLAVALATATITGSFAGTAAAKPDAKNTPAPKPDFTLTLLHGNDQESALLPITGTDGGSYAGAARFTELLQREEAAAGKGKPGPGQAGKRGVLTVSAGDHFLPGPNLAASDDIDGRIYDAIAFSEADWDVAIFGNHDFDRNPDFLAEWLGDVDSGTPFVSNNLGFEDEPALRAYVEDGTIVTSHVEKVKGERIGIIGLTTPDLRQLTSSRNVTVDPALAEIANAQAAAYERAGVDKVVLVSHLQDIDNEMALAPQLRGVDVIVGAGGGETLASEGDRVLPGSTIAGAYPLLAKDAEGEVVPVVTTSGLYRYVGRLVLNFDARGELLSIDDQQSKPLLVAAEGAGAVQPDRVVQREVEQPVAAFVAELANEIVATSEVALDGSRPAIRQRETNLGNLVADALLTAGQREAAAVGVTAPIVALQNGGGIRNASVIPAGPVSALDTYSITPFFNLVAVAPEMPVSTFIAGVERGLSGLPGEAGHFAHAAGYTVTYTLTEPAGSRIVDLVLDDGRVLVEDGVPTGAPGTISVATIDFLLRASPPGGTVSGDGYPFGGVDFTVLGLSQQEALQRYLEEDLGGVVTAAQYPEGGEGRITAAP